MEKVKNAVSWAASFLFFCTLLVSFPSFASLLFLTGLLICLPLLAIQQRLRERGLNVGVKIALAVVLMVVGAVLTPSERLERSSDARSVQEATQEEQAASETAQEPEEQEPQPQKEQEQVSTEELVNRMNAVIAEALGDEFSLSAEGNTITVDIWADDATVLKSAGAALDVEGGAEQWDSMIETCKGFADKLQTSVDSLGRSDVTVCVNLVNGDEHDHSLLSIAHGEVLYNVVTDYQNTASETESAEESTEGTSYAEHDIRNVSVTFADSVRNDVTGRWRLAKTSDNIPIQEYALSYYKTYFTNNDEIHFFINYANNTTASITYLLGSLEVDVYTHIDGEENDAKILPGGDLISKYWVNIETGEIEKL